MSNSARCSNSVGKWPIMVHSLILDQTGLLARADVIAPGRDLSYGHSWSMIGESTGSACPSRLPHRNSAGIRNDTGTGNGWASEMQIERGGADLILSR